MANWRDLNSRSAPGRAGAVVKANAYGLGVDPIVPALLKAGCDTFFVALPQEGVAVRALAPEATIYVLNGVLDGQIATLTAHHLRPLLASADHLHLWAQTDGAPYGLQVDSGMNRLGLRVDEALAMRDTLLPGCTHVMSHFACADEPDHPLNGQQIESFQAVSAVYSDIESSLSNSAAIISSGAHGHPLTRPGIALYGGAAV
ncbi:MAG: alanine racemase, partial [Pseudomonadota bacterium]